MRVLLTGAFGHIGSYTIPELLRQGHQVRGLDLQLPRTEVQAARFGAQIEVLWGDICAANVANQAVQDVDAVIHLAAILPPESDEKTAWARQVNLNGTRLLLEACQRQPKPPNFLFASTFDAFGHTQKLPPPRKSSDPLQATDPYSEHKIAAEQIVRSSGLEWLIFRFSDVPWIALRGAHPIMFEISLNNRFEVIHPTDAALALTNTLSCPEAWGKILLVGGGKSCQITYREYLFGLLTAMGVGTLPEAAFTQKEYCTDWLDSEESQRLLKYQRHTFQDIVAEINQLLGWKRYFVPLAGPFVRRSMLKMSPYWKS